MRRHFLAIFLLPWTAMACETLFPHHPPPSPPPPPPAEPLPTPAPEAEPRLEVKKVEEEIVVAAWAEPRRFPEGGGAVQLLVRVQKRGGARFPGVQVRFQASSGALYSRGRILTTDSQGMTRDQLTSREAATVTLNAGGTRYRFQVLMDESAK